MTDEFDVIISGAGPAGCTAALAMGSSGLRVALTDKEKSPGKKVCGDAIPAYVPKVLNTINPEYLQAFNSLGPKISVNTCRIVAPSGRVLDLKFEEYGYICRRIIFDDFLFALAKRLANVTILSETSIKDVRINDNRVTVRTGKDEIMKSRIIIGCDGAPSITGSLLAGTKPDPRHYSSAVRGYFKNVRDIPAETFEMHFLKKYLPGYFWIFPLPENRANVGLGMPSGMVAGDKINLRKELQKIIESVPYIRDRFSDAEPEGEVNGYFLPLGTRKIQISGNRFMLCGDAASLVDPATGAGIGQAMVSGRYAGWHALKCFEKNDFSADFMKGYDTAVNEKIGKENRRRGFLRKIFIRNPVIFNAGINLTLRSKSVYRIFLNQLK